MDRYRQVAWLLFIIGAIAVVWKVASAGSRQPYAFLDHTHPVSREMDTSGTWTYYSLSGEPKKFADDARRELLAKGFVEDSSQRPWFRFTKGVDEVIVCDHSEVAWKIDSKGTYPIHQSMPARYKNPKGWAVAHIHDGSKSRIDYWCFQIKRFLLQW